MSTFNNDCRKKGSILKLWESTSLYNSIITPEERNKYEVTFIYKENQEKSLINTEQMVFDQHIFGFNRNRLHHCGIMENTFFIIITSMMKTVININ